MRAALFAFASILALSACNQPAAETATREDVAQTTAPLLGNASSDDDDDDA